MPKFRILHWSDSHNSAAPAGAAHDMNTLLQPDMFICTGDIVNNKYGDSIANNAPYDFWLVLGNHECITTEGTNVNPYDWSKQPTQSQKITAYFQPIIDAGLIDLQLDTVAPDATWWHKRFDSLKIDVVGIDCTLRSGTIAFNNHSSWFHSVLDNDREDGYGVIVVSHMPPSNVPLIDCDWTCQDFFRSFNGYPDTAGFEVFYAGVRATYNEMVNQANLGCNILAFICGHEHADGIMNAGTDTKFPMITIGSTIIDSYNDIYRNANLSNSLCPVTNLYEFDDEAKSLVCWRYGAEYAHTGARRFMFAYNYITHEFTSAV